MRSTWIVAFLFASTIMISGFDTLYAEDKINLGQTEFFCPWGYGVDGKVPGELSAFPFGDGTPMSQWELAWNSASSAGRAYLLLGAKFRNKAMYASFSRKAIDNAESVVVQVRYGCFSRKWTMKAVVEVIGALEYDWTGTPVAWPNMARQDEGKTWEGSSILPKP